VSDGGPKVQSVCKICCTDAAPKSGAFGGPRLVVAVAPADAVRVPGGHKSHPQQQPILGTFNPFRLADTID